MRRWGDVDCDVAPLGVNFSDALILEEGGRKGLELVTLIVPILSIVLLKFVLVFVCYVRPTMTCLPS